MFQLPPDAGTSLAELGGLDPDGPAGGWDRVSQLLASRPPVECFGRYSSQEMMHGFRALAGLNADQYLKVRFEDLVSKPAEVLRTIGEVFDLDVDRDDWIEQAAGLVRGIPPARFDRLSDDEQVQLAEACRVGGQLLGRTA